MSSESTTSRQRRATDGGPRATPRPILITGGAPRVAVDAIRFLSVKTSGNTAVRLQELLQRDGLTCDLLLGIHAAPHASALRFDDRADLERELRAWIRQYPDGVVVMAAAVNDYAVAAIETRHGNESATHAPGDKVPSGADELVIRLRPATKIVDHLRTWGHQGPLVACKYEAADSVIDSARSLRGRIGAALVVANSLDGSVQALVDAIRIQELPDRDALLTALAGRLGELARR